MNKKNPSCVVSIAGTDPSGGAGIQADIKAISATGSYAASVITVLVAQNTCAVQSILEIPAAFVEQQFVSVFSDLRVDAVKIGMLHQAAIIEVVACALERYQPLHIVFDPVMVAKNGCALIDPDTIELLKNRLLPLCTVLTPNIPEAEKLAGRSIVSTTDMEEVAVSIGQQFDVNVLLKGGHFQGDQSSDVLYDKNQASLHWFHASRVHTKNTHGTGCSLSSAIASYLSQDLTLIDAISKAKHYLTQAILSGSSWSVGQGCGPVDHFYFLKSKAPEICIESV